MEKEKEELTTEQMEYIIHSNQFLQKIATEQTNKIRKLEEEIKKLKELGSGGCSILEELPEEELDKLKAMAIEEN
tara:strand:+ start:332 stop:556 length:225 start_codon:yes stop_codon:yes gene_type:complete